MNVLVLASLSSLQGNEGTSLETIKATKLYTTLTYLTPVNDYFKGQNVESVSGVPLELDMVLYSSDVNGLLELHLLIEAKELGVLCLDITPYSKLMPFEKLVARGGGVVEEVTKSDLVSFIPHVNDTRFLRIKSISMTGEDNWRFLEGIKSNSDLQKNIIIEGFDLHNDELTQTGMKELYEHNKDTWMGKKQGYDKYNLYQVVEEYTLAEAITKFKTKSDKSVQSYLSSMKSISSDFRSKD